MTREPAGLRTTRRSLGWAAAALLVMAAPYGVPRAHAASPGFEIGGTRVVLPVPPGMCRIDREHSRDRLLLDYVSKTAARRNRVLLVLVDCTELRDFRAGSLDLLRNYGMSAIPLKVIDRTIPQPRSDFVRGMTDFFRTRGLAMLERRKGDFARRIESALPGLKVNRQKFLGILHSNEDALHLGFIQRLAVPGTGDVVIAGVFSMTVIRGKMIAFYRYKRYRGVKTIADLLNLQGRWVQEALRANEKGA